MSHNTAFTRVKADSSWTAAAFLGSLWGAVEIIIGSFLHNLRVPFTGTILAALGIAILIGGHRLWNEKGLIWRAGVICALMKSISPSAVIIGPMVGISMEALTLEFFVRVSKGNIAGLLIGGMVAACLPFVQSVVSLMITYGFNIAFIYLEIYKIAAKNIGISSLDALGAIYLFLAINSIFGLSAALLGMKLGKTAIRPGAELIPLSMRGNDLWKSPEKRRYSIVNLIANVALIPVILYIISGSPLYVSAGAVLIYSLGATLLYPRVWSRFRRPKIWIELALVALFAGLLLGNIYGTPGGGFWSGIAIGVQMSLRALFMIAAFTLVGFELRNPVIIGWIMRKGFGQTGAALEIAFDTLPLMAGMLGDQRSLFRSPVKSLSGLLHLADRQLAEFRRRAQAESEITIVTGRRGAGKSSLIARLAEEIRRNNLPLGGISSPAVLRGSDHAGYDVVDLRTGERVRLCGPGGEGIKIGGFTFYPDGLDFGNRVLRESGNNDPAIIMIDEIGPLELAGGGWAKSIGPLLAERKAPVLIVVREKLIERVTQRWRIEPYEVLNLDRDDPGVIYEKILKKIGKTFIATKIEP